MENIVRFSYKYRDTLGNILSSTKCPTICLSVEILYSSVILEIMFIIISQHNPGINTPCFCVYCMFQPIAAIIRYIELLQSPFLLSAIPPYTGQRSRIGSALRRYVVYVIKCIKY
jgi:hypothetical protein